MSRCAALGVGLALLGAVTSTPTSAVPRLHRPTYSVSIILSNYTPEVGDTIKVTGGVTHAPTNERVQLQVQFRKHKHWKRIDTARLSNKGTYKFKVNIDTNRTRSYRVVMLRAGFEWISSGAKVHVWEWVPVGQNGSGFGLGSGFATADATMAGILYPHSLIAADTSGRDKSIDFYSGVYCYGFRAGLGVSDSSPAGATAVITVGGQPTDVARGVVKTIEVPFHDAFVPLIITATGNGNTPQVIGSPETFCKTPNT